MKGRALLLSLCVLLGAFASGSSAIAKRPGGLSFLGELPQLPPQEGLEGHVVQIDQAGRKLYFAYRNNGDGSVPHIVEYDLRPEIPKRIREARLASADLAGASPYTVSFDPKRRRLLFLVPSQAAGSKIDVFDLKKFKETASWDLEATLPSFVPFGASFSRADDLVFVFGEFSQAAVLSGLAKPIGPATSIVALNAADGSLAWVRPIPQCQHALTTYRVGALVAQSRSSHALYVACVTRGLGNGDAYPGQAGLVRVWVTRGADQQSAKDFQIDFFPISGSYYSGDQGSGIAFFDYSTDRFFLQSLSPSTPGAWVFDGARSAWVGFIGSIDSTDHWAGLDQGSGHYYIGGEGLGGDGGGGYLLIADGRSTPIPQGEAASITVEGFIATDPLTHRLFIPTTEGLPHTVTSYWRILVARDETPNARPAEPPRYDALTADIPEGQGALTDYSGGVNGYGARAVLIGGYKAALGSAGRDANVVVDQLTQGRVRSGDRGITAARVPSVDLRKVGASATAQSLVRDTNTESEMTENGNVEWPWQPAACLDGAGEKVSDDKSSQGDEAVVMCDLGKETSEARSSFGAIKAGPINVGSSSLHALAFRDAQKGLITQAVARARGVHIAIPSGGSLSIGDVEAIASTAAHGRPGTTKTTWSRTISGIIQRDADDKVVQRFGECTSSSKQDTCGDLFARINEALGVRLEIKLPQPDLIETPKGAFAGIQQSDADFYQGRTVLNQGAAFAAEAESRAVPALQIVVYNDSVERSRLLVQLAAVQANSIYTISPAPKPGRVPGTTSNKEIGGGSTSSSSGSGLGVGSVDPGSLPLSSPGDTATATSPVTPVLATPVEQIAEGMRFLVRSPAEAVLLGSVWLLFGGAGFAVFRRRMLLEVLGR